MTKKERQEYHNLNRLYALGKATRKQMLRELELQRKDNAERGSV